MKSSRLPLRASALLLAAAAMVTATAKPVRSQPAPQKITQPAKAEDDGEFANFAQWQDVSAFIDRMVAKHGFDRAALEATMRQARYVDNTIQLIKPAPPTKPKNWTAYRLRFVEPVRINAGIAFWNTYQDALARAEQQYGVPPEIIVGLIGVETIYGRHTGNFRVMDAITTLAFAYPDTPTRQARMDYFRSELESTLLYARDEGIDPFSLQGSYAGAIGLPQFMPGSILQYAVDFDGDGKIDLRNSPVDAIGSVANYLAQHGWQRGEPMVFPVNVAATTEENASPLWSRFMNQGLSAKFALDELRANGVTPVVAPPADLRYGLIDLQNGFGPTEYWLGTANFFAITQYNRSYFYAMSVIDLGNAVRTARAAAQQPKAE